MVDLPPMVDFSPLPEGLFDIILCDPPWAYNDTRDHASAGMARSSYSVISPEDLAELPVDSIASKPSVLCLWTTGPKMREGIGLLQAWGFTYCTILFTWVKRYRNGSPYSGLGHYTKSGTEFVLLGRRGN